MVTLAIDTSFLCSFTTAAGIYAQPRGLIPVVDQLPFVAGCSYPDHLLDFSFFFLNMADRFRCCLLQLSFTQFVASLFLMPNATLLCCIWLPEFHLLPDVTITCPIGGLSVPVVECNPVTLSRVNRILFVANCNYHLPSWWLIFSCCQVHSYYMAIGLHFCCRLPLY